MDQFITSLKLTVDESHDLVDIPLDEETGYSRPSIYCVIV